MSKSGFKSGAKYIMYGVIIVSLVIGIPVGCYQVKRAWNYSMGYERQVTDTVCKMVKPESLVNPDAC